MGPDTDPHQNEPRKPKLKRWKSALITIAILNEIRGLLLAGYIWSSAGSNLTSLI